MKTPANVLPANDSTYKPIFTSCFMEFNAATEDSEHLAFINDVLKPAYVDMVQAMGFAVQNVKQNAIQILGWEGNKPYDILQHEISAWTCQSDHSDNVCKATVFVYPDYPFAVGNIQSIQAEIEKIKPENTTLSIQAIQDQYACVSVGDITVECKHYETWENNSRIALHLLLARLYEQMKFNRWAHTSSINRRLVINRADCRIYFEDSRISEPFSVAFNAPFSPDDPMQSSQSLAIVTTSLSECLINANSIIRHNLNKCANDE